MDSLKNHQNFRLTIMDGGKLVLADGDCIMGNMVYRFKKGLLNDVVDKEGNVYPAVESRDGNHIEHWKEGVLHCENSPAIVDNIDNYEEWYFEGNKVPSGGK